MKEKKKIDLEIEMRKCSEYLEDLSNYKNQSFIFVNQKLIKIEDAIEIAKRYTQQEVKIIVEDFAVVLNNLLEIKRKEIEFIIKGN